MKLTVNGIVNEFKISRQNAKIIRDIAFATDTKDTINYDLLTFSTLEDIRKNWMPKLGFSRVSGIRLISSMLSNANQLTFGAEYLTSYQDTFTRAEGIDYVNIGDPYDVTIIHDLSDDSWHISSWSDMVESNELRFGTNEE